MKKPVLRFTKLYQRSFLFFFIGKVTNRKLRRQSFKVGESRARLLSQYLSKRLKFNGEINLQHLGIEWINWSHIIFFMLVEFFYGLYCNFTHLHVFQRQPASFLNTHQFNYTPRKSLILTILILLKYSTFLQRPQPGFDPLVADDQIYIRTF